MHHAFGAAKPPPNPPTATAAGDGGADGVIVLLPPGWQLDQLKIHVGLPGSLDHYTRRVYLPGKPGESVSIERPGRTPAQATARVVAVAWDAYLSAHSLGEAAAVAEACHMPQPFPPAGVCVVGILPGPLPQCFNPVSMSGDSESVRVASVQKSRGRTLRHTQLLDILGNPPPPEVAPMVVSKEFILRGSVKKLAPSGAPPRGFDFIIVDDPHQPHGAAPIPPLAALAYSKPPGARWCPVAGKHGIAGVSRFACEVSPPVGKTTTSE